MHPSPMLTLQFAELRGKSTANCQICLQAAPPAGQQSNSNSSSRGTMRRSRRITSTHGRRWTSTMTAAWPKSPSARPSGCPSSSDRRRRRCPRPSARCRPRCQVGARGICNLACLFLYSFVPGRCDERPCFLPLFRGHLHFHGRAIHACSSAGAGQLADSLSPLAAASFD